ncbi:MAG: PepSY domain-containing protein [Leptolyngbya sp. SIOISBB]|nr:PepSY domain-containing protein [Leptolyngbya sp. SIOISBB]
MPINRARLRQLHTALVPFMVLPLLLTLTTGVLFQLAVASDRANDFLWLLELHRGKFGQINLDWIYPFFNALGLLTFLLTGILMWLQLPSRKYRHNRDFK